VSTTRELRTLARVTDFHADLALLALRIACGMGCIAHGWPKLGHAADFARAHHFPVWLGHVAAWVQFGGGVLLMLGVFTRLAAAALTVFGLVATYVLIVQKKEPFAQPGVHGWDSGVLYTVIPFALLLTGPGRFALGGAWGF
jgi:putative oxidoreductase